MLKEDKVIKISMGGSQHALKGKGGIVNRFKINYCFTRDFHNAINVFNTATFFHFVANIVSQTRNM